MDEIADRYARIATTFAARLAEVRDDQWTASTPCTEWDVRALVTHVISTQLRVRSLLDATIDTSVDPDGDLGAQFAKASDSIHSALTNEALATTDVESGFGAQPFEMLVSSLCCSDTLIHTWDLARAIGADERLDAEAVAVAAAALAPVDTAIRRPGGFGDKLEPGSDPDPQSALLAFCGRAV